MQRGQVRPGSQSAYVAILSKSVHAWQRYKLRAKGGTYLDTAQIVERSAICLKVNEGHRHVFNTSQNDWHSTKK